MRGLEKEVWEKLVSEREREKERERSASTLY